ncbi:MAG: L-aspartate oxidase, partial [Desulfobulbaceae bacterium]|nr:L-aspartate oxidase [Desulfobulbaceae bacterium]
GGQSQNFGGDQAARTCAAADRTGHAILHSLYQQNIRAKTHFFDEYFAVDLLKDEDGLILGAVIFNIQDGQIVVIEAKTTLLATGGAGQLYKTTTNALINTGDGMGMAMRAGIPLQDMEFFQFHPTCLFHPEAKSFLISEALRGEGAILRLKDGTPFMQTYHPMKELAPRDIVARAIDSELKRTGDDCVFLDISHQSDEFIKQRFPNIYEKCLTLGIDITKEAIPVVPAAHYLCGGIVTDMEGKTNIPGLYACGEAACTGMHGANRLASNSLLEGLVFAGQIFNSISKEKTKSINFPPIPAWNPGKATDSDESIVVSQNWDEIRRLMQNYVGIVRTNKRLARAKRKMDLIQAEIKEYFWTFIITSDLLELRNIATIAELIIDSAMMRKESRGLHFNMDYPEIDDKSCKHDTIIK